MHRLRETPRRVGLEPWKKRREPKNQGPQPCARCGRCFNPESLAKHVKYCKGCYAKTFGAKGYGFGGGAGFLMCPDK